MVCEGVEVIVSEFNASERSEKPARRGQDLTSFAYICLAL